MHAMTVAAWQLQQRHAPMVVALAMLALWPVPQQLFDLWMDSDRPYSHGLLVAPIAALLLWRVSRSLGRAPAAPSWIALALFVVTTLVWLLGAVADALVIQQVLFPPLLLLAAAAVLGWGTARELLFPVGFLFFAIPVWSYLVPSLQALTVMAVRTAVDGFAIPVLVEGNLITIPEGTFEIAGGCAGLHYFVVALVIASLYAYLETGRLWARAAIVLAGAALAVFTNWVRVASLVVIGHRTEMQHYLVAEDHYYYGWVLFAVALVPFFLIARRLAAADERGSTLGGSAMSAPMRHERRPRRAVVVLFCLASLLPFAVTRLLGSDASARAEVVLTLPAGNAGWAGPVAAPEPGWWPSFSGADGEVRGRYSDGDEPVDVYVAAYLGQEQGRELIGEANRFAEPGAQEDWGSARLVAAHGPSAGQVGERVFRTEGAAEERRLVWYWYVIGETATASESKAKLLQALRRLFGKGGGTVIALSLRCGRDCEDAARLGLQRFAEAMASELERTARAAQAGRD